MHDGCIPSPTLSFYCLPVFDLIVLNFGKFVNNVSLDNWSSAQRRTYIQMNGNYIDRAPVSVIYQNI